MADFINKLYDSFEKGEYNKFIEIAQLAFNLIAPSYSYIFLYKRHLFKELNNIQLLLLCLILNTMLFFLIWFIIKTKTKIINELENNKLNYKQIALYSNIGTQIFITAIVFYTWANYFFFMTLQNKSNIHMALTTHIIFVCAMFIILSLDSLHKIIKAKKFKKIIGFIILIIICLEIIVKSLQVHL